jgi:hypothetical protein
MSRRSTAKAAGLLTCLVSISTWAQATPPGGSADGINSVPPAGAATVRTPGTPGAADTPGAVQVRPNSNLPADSSSPEAIRAMKKEAAKGPKSSAPSADAAKPAAVTAPK